ncbi:MAG TPA: nucleotidyltransferase family protein [Stellaceae bacterium]|nr:nucleotidyltransferase family protein [Stellaceae bacterium]
MNRNALIAGALLRPESLRRLSLGDWENLVGWSRAEQLLPRIAFAAEQLKGLEIPPAVRRHLDSARLAWEGHRRAILWDVNRIATTLAPIETPVVLLKGAAYLVAGLRPAPGRAFSDIDIMVRRETLDAVETALLQTGWQMEELDAYDQHYYRTWMHELPPMQHAFRRTVLDVHHTIAPLTARRAVDAETLFAAAAPVAGGPKLYVLAPVDMLLHAVIHLMQEGEFDKGLRDLFDIDQLLRQFGEEPRFWPALLARSAEHGLDRPLFYAVTQLRRQFETPMPGEFLEEIARRGPPWPAKQLMSAIFHAGISGNSPRLARDFLYIRGHYMRMPLRLLVPHLARKFRHRFDPAEA